MINSIHLTMVPPSPEMPPMIPAFLLFSNAPQADHVLLNRFAPLTKALARGDQVRVSWLLPDPQVSLGRIMLNRTQATTYQAHNQASDGVQLVLVRDAPGATDRITLPLNRFFVDWLGVLGDKRLRRRQGDDAPVTGLAQRRAQLLREQKRFAPAVALLAAALERLSTPAGGFYRQAAFVLHEAALLAEAMGNGEAWEYFDTMALMIYPNCHDALIGLALRAQDSPPQVHNLLGRAYAVRPLAEDLELFARRFARLTRQPIAEVRTAIRAHASDTDLDAPLFGEAGQAVAVKPDEVLAHLRALA